MNTSRKFLPVAMLLAAGLLLSGIPGASPLAAVATEQPRTVEKQPEKRSANRSGRRRGDPKQAAKRAAALRCILKELGLGTGAAIADIGAGNGQDSWVFAKAVGKKGAVYSEEITESKVKSLREQAERRKLPQVRPVLGKVDDPGLEPASVELAYMHSVYHHFTRPRAMLRGLWRGLKPGGYLVVIDRHRGTLRDWVEREKRGSKHFWIAETTVVREAREEGFAFDRCLEKCWPQDDQFVLVFHRPRNVSEPGQDPDPLPPLPIQQTAKLLLPAHGNYQHPVFIALGQARELIKPILARSDGPGLDVILEEWATQKTEHPPLPKGVSLPAMLTENGDPHLDETPVDVVFFLDSYHLLFHAPTLLARLKEKLTPTARVFVLDRKGEPALSRRLASHHRRIAPEMVKAELAKAGFHLVREETAPAPDRFLLVFAPDEPKSNTAAQPASAWINLFDGKTLNGWMIKCRPEDNDKRDCWRVENGAITARAEKNTRHNYIWLLTEREFDNFELRLKVQTFANVKGNSGIQVRSRYDDDAHWLDGPQVDIHPAGPWRCGFIYDETREVKAWLWPDVGGPANAKPSHAPAGWKWEHADNKDAWNDVRILCDGLRIKTIINGITVADCNGAGRLDDAAHRKHRVGLKGHIGLQIHPGTEILVRFKDIQLRPLD